jgi:hypothetical protein
MLSFPFWSIGFNKCIVPSNYTESCYATSDCRTNLSLICNNIKYCSCPIKLSNNKCDCVREYNSEYYWNGTSCTSAASYGHLCQTGKDYSCKTLTEKTYCNSSGICDCSEEKFLNGTKCQNKCGINWKWINGKCYGITTNSTVQVTLQVVTSSHIQTACFNELTAKLAVLDNNDVNAFLNSIASNGTEYYVDAFMVSSGIYKSFNGSWTVTNWCNNHSGNKDCVIYQDDCFESHDCHGHELICEYTPN